MARRPETLTPKQASLWAAQGRAIAAARQRAGLSGPELAARLGVPLPTLRGWEQGRRQPDLDHRRLLVDLVGADLDISESCPCCGRPYR